MNPGRFCKLGHLRRAGRCRVVMNHVMVVTVMMMAVMPVVVDSGGGCRRLEREARQADDGGEEDGFKAHSAGYFGCVGLYSERSQDGVLSQDFRTAGKSCDGTMLKNPFPSGASGYGDAAGAGVATCCRGTGVLSLSLLGCSHYFWPGPDKGGFFEAVRFSRSFQNPKKGWTPEGGFV